MQVALVSVGDELLAGETTNTNAAWLGRRLTDRGATVERVTVVPDRIADIARVINEYRAEYDAVVVTGGLGPTHDDVTMEGVAAAVGRDLLEHPDAVEWLIERGGYERSDLDAGTAHLPEDARVLHNEVGVAPGAVVESIYVLPGVPDEMRAMFETVADEFTGQKRHTESIRVDEPESALVDRLVDVRDRFDVKVGSYPGEHVRVRLESTDEDGLNAAADWLRERVDLAVEQRPPDEDDGEADE